MKMLSIRLLLAAASAGLLAMAFTDIWDGAVWFALAPMLYLMAEAPTRKQAVLLAFVFSWVWSLPCLWFLAKTTQGGAIAGGLYTGLWYVIALLVIRFLARRGILLAVFGTAVVWCLIEIGRSRIPIFQFPWLLLGHATAGWDTLRQSADLFGVYGLSFLVASVNATLAFLVAPLVVERLSAPPGPSRARHAILVSVPVLLLIALLYGHCRIWLLEPKLLADGPRVVVIQGCEYQKLDRTADHKQRQLEQHLDLHRQAAAQEPPPDLICWAETMVPGVYNKHSYGAQFRKAVAECGIPTLCGADWVHPDDIYKPLMEQRWYNMALLLDGKAEIIGKYAKRRLVPYGENIPFKSIIPGLRNMTTATRDAYAYGTDPSPIVPLAGLDWGLNVCVEDCHPDLAREAAWDGAQAFLNVTNDGWFAGTHEPATHLRGALFRCVETRRPMVRATNTGISAFIDPLGRVTIDPPLDEIGLGDFKVTHLAVPGSTVSMWLGEGWVAVLLIVLGIGCGCVDAKLATRCFE